MKKVMHDVDANFIVSDNHETTSSSDSDAGPTRKSRERKKKVKEGKKKSSNIPPDESSKNEDSDEESETHAERRKRLDERKARKGGDVLAWMSRKGSVRVNVQVQARSVILDMAMYKLQLLADEESQEEELDTTEQNRPQSDTDSDESIPRGKRIKPLKGSSDESSDEEIKKEPVPKKKSKKKMKKRKKEKKKLERSRSESPVEEVVEVWTPTMYRNWDRKGPKKHSDHKAKAKKHFNRSISMEAKNSSQESSLKSGQNKVHRSFSTMDSAENSSARTSPQKSFSAMDGYVGVGPVRGFGPPMATLPKIPKLKKSE